MLVVDELDPVSARPVTKEKPVEPHRFPNGAWPAASLDRGAPIHENRSGACWARHSKRCAGEARRNDRPRMDWAWLVEQLKHRNLQNRLGFLVSLARALADKQGTSEPAGTLARWERTLEDARLAKTDVLSRSLTSAEQQYFQVHRSPTAMHWNLLTGLTAESLRYAE